MESTEPRGPITGRASRCILLASVLLLTIAALGDPADTILHMKVPAFVLTILVWLYRRGWAGNTVSPAIWTITLTAGVVIPLAWTILGIVHSDVHSGDVSFKDRKSTRLNSSHFQVSRMPSSA